MKTFIYLSLFVCFFINCNNLFASSKSESTKKIDCRQAVAGEKELELIESLESFHQNLGIEFPQSVRAYDNDVTLINSLNMYEPSESELESKDSLVQYIAMLTKLTNYLIQEGVDIDQVEPYEIDDLLHMALPNYSISHQPSNNLDSYLYKLDKYVLVSNFWRTNRLPRLSSSRPIIDSIVDDIKLPGTKEVLTSSETQANETAASPYSLSKPALPLMLSLVEIDNLQSVEIRNLSLVAANHTASHNSFLLGHSQPLNTNLAQVEDHVFFAEKVASNNQLKTRDKHLLLASFNEKLFIGTKDYKTFYNLTPVYKPYRMDLPTANKPQLKLDEYTSLNTQLNYLGLLFRDDHRFSINHNVSWNNKSYTESFLKNIRLGQIAGSGDLKIVELYLSSPPSPSDSVISHTGQKRNLSYFNLLRAYFLSRLNFNQRLEALNLLKASSQYRDWFETLYFLAQSNVSGELEPDSDNTLDSKIIANYKVYVGHEAVVEAEVTTEFDLILALSKYHGAERIAIKTNTPTEYSRLAQQSYSAESFFKRPGNGHSISKQQIVIYNQRTGYTYKYNIVTEEFAILAPDKTILNYRILDKEDAHDHLGRLISAD